MPRSPRRRAGPSPRARSGDPGKSGRMSGRAVLVRIPAAAGLVAGAALLSRPDDVLARLAPEYPRERRWVVRLLGARLLAQHAAVLAAPTPAVLRAAAGIDLLH